MPKVRELRNDCSLEDILKCEDCGLKHWDVEYIEKTLKIQRGDPCYGGPCT